MKKKGFTLVELLAVIVILGIILLIAVPKIISTVDGAKISTLEDTVKMIAASAEREYVSRNTLGTLDQTNDPITCDDVVSLSANDYSNCSISFTDDLAYVNITGIGKFDGIVCTGGTRADGNCGILPDVYSESILNGAYPRITDGMIPVTIADNGTVTTVSISDSNWYNYTNKKWANVVLVRETGTQTRSYYQTNANVTVNEADILAYLVWIPRYRYTLFNVAGTAATYSGSTCTANCPQSINITFENAGTTKSTGATNGTQLTHPTFTYGTTELNGIWVGKFETTQGTVANVGTTNPTIKPNITSWRNQSISTEFATSLLFGTSSIYGLNGDSRMSKNSDWGAVTYLSNSVYGLNTEMRINNQNGYTTGCGASAIDGASNATCEISFGGAASYPQSTTGNIYGVFDMNGGSWEYQMGSYTNVTNDLYSGLCNLYNSGFNGTYGQPSYTGCNASIISKADGLSYPSNKYYKIYSSTGWATNVGNLGDALGETLNWYRDFNGFVVVGYPWFMRSGTFSANSFAGGFFFNNASGYSSVNISFRTIVTTS